MKTLKQNTAPKPRTKQSYQNLGKLPNVFISSWLNRFSHYNQDYFTRQCEAHVWVSTVTELLLLPVRSQAHHEGNRQEPVLLLLHLLLKWNTSLPVLPRGTWHVKMKQSRHQLTPAKLSSRNICHTFRLCPQLLSDHRRWTLLLCISGLWTKEVKSRVSACPEISYFPPCIPFHMPQTVSAFSS